MRINSNIRASESPKVHQWVFIYCKSFSRDGGWRKASTQNVLKLGQTERQRRSQKYSRELYECDDVRMTLDRDFWATATQKLQQRRQIETLRRVLLNFRIWTRLWDFFCWYYSLLNKQNYENEMWISSIQYVSVTSLLNGCYLNEIIFSAVILALNMSTFKNIVI